MTDTSPVYTNINISFKYIGILKQTQIYLLQYKLLHSFVPAFLPCYLNQGNYSPKFSALSKFLQACYYSNNLTSATLYCLQKFNSFCTDTKFLKNVFSYMLIKTCLFIVQRCVNLLTIYAIYLETGLYSPCCEHCLVNTFASKKILLLIFYLLITCSLYKVFDEL